MISFCLWGLRITIRFYFLAVLCLMSVLFPDGLGLWCAAMSLLHECGHLLAMASFGAMPRELVFSYEGISIAPSRKLLSPGREAVVLLAGSAFNFLMAAVLIPFPSYSLSSFLLGVFNFLPLSGLDGGKLLILCCGRFFYVRGEAFCRGLSLIVGAALSFFALWLFFRKGNFTLLLTVAYFLLLT